jgi:hypothetical protein
LAVRVGTLVALGVAPEALGEVLAVASEALAAELAVSAEQAGSEVLVELEVSGPALGVLVELRIRCLDHSAGMECLALQSSQMDAYLNFSNSSLQQVARMLVVGSSVALDREQDLVEASAGLVDWEVSVVGLAD